MLVKIKRRKFKMYKLLDPNREFVFNQWSEFKEQPKEFACELSEFMTINIYNSFAEFLGDNDHLMEDEYGEKILLSDIMDSESSLSDFLNYNFFDEFNRVKLHELDSPVIFAEAIADHEVVKHI